MRQLTLTRMLATVQEQLMQVDELLAQLEGSLAVEPTPRPSVAANIRSLEKEHRVLQQMEQALHMVQSMRLIGGEV